MNLLVILITVFVTLGIFAILISYRRIWCSKVKIIIVTAGPFSFWVLSGSWFFEALPKRDFAINIVYGVLAALPVIFAFTALLIRAAFKREGISLREWWNAPF